MPSFRSFDGTEIAYKVRGEGPPLVLVNGLACVESYWKYTIEHFSPLMQVITYDLRGHGASGLPATDENVEISDHAKDLQALVRELRLDKPVLAGFSLGVQIMFESYRHMGESLAALVAVTGPYRNPMATFYGLTMPKVATDSLIKALQTFERPLGVVWKALFSSPYMYNISKLVGAANCSREDIQGFYDHAREMDLGLFLKFARGASRHTAEDVLPNINIPTLIIGAEKDTFTPPSLSEYMVRSIPYADYLHLKGATHTGIVEQPHIINPRMEDFLRERVAHLFAKVQAPEAV